MSIGTPDLIANLVVRYDRLASIRVILLRPFVENHNSVLIRKTNFPQLCCQPKTGSALILPYTFIQHALRTRV